MTSNSLLFRQLYEALCSAQKTLKCPICLEYIVNPAQLTSCGHVFCKLCIDKSNTSATGQPCPVCNKLFTRRDVVSAKEEMTEYKDMLETFTAQLSLDMGFDVTTYKPPHPSAAALSPICKKWKDKNVNVEAEGTIVDEQHLEKSRITRKSSRRNYMADDSRSTYLLKPNEDIHIVSSRYSLVADMKNDPGGTSNKKQMEQFSEEDLDIFFPKNRRTETCAKKQLSAEFLPEVEDQKDYSKKRYSKLKTYQNKNKITGKKEAKFLGTESEKESVKSATKLRTMKITSFVKSDLKNSRNNEINSKNTLEIDKIYKLSHVKAKYSKREKNLVSEQNFVPLSTENSQCMEETSFLGTPAIRLDDSEPKARVDFMNKAEKELKEKVENCNENELLQKKVDESSRNNKGKEMNTNITRSKGNKCYIEEDEMKSCEQEQIEKEVIKNNIEYKGEEIRSCKKILRSRKSNSITEEEEKKCCKELLERKVVENSNNFKGEEISSGIDKKITRTDGNNIKETELNNYKKDKVEGSDDEWGKKGIDNFKKNIRRKRDKNDIQKEGLKSSEQERLEKKGSESGNQWEEIEINNWKKNVLSSKRNKNCIKKEEVNSFKQEKIENKMEESGSNWEEKETSSWKKNIVKSKTNKNVIQNEEMNSSKQEKIENKMDGSGNNSEEKETNSWKKNVLRSKRNTNYIQKEELNSSEQEHIKKKLENFDIQCEEKQTESHKTEIITSKRNKNNVQREETNSSKQGKIENKMNVDDERDLFYEEDMKDVLERKVTDRSGQCEQDSQESSSASPKNKLLEENKTDVYSKKRKRVDKAKSLKTNNVTDLNSLLLRSPAKKKLCSDIGVQTSPSRLMSLYHEMKRTFIIKNTNVQTEDINIKHIDSCTSANFILPEYKSPVTVLNSVTHSTPTENIEITDDYDDIAMQITQKNPNFLNTQITDSNCKTNGLINKGLDAGGLKTPLAMKISVPGSCSGQGFSIVSNPTTSEKRRINDNKFFNDSIGIPGDSLLEHSELSSSILENTVQGNETFTEVVENTPQTVNRKPKRISRRLLEFYESNSNSGDMFSTNDDEKVLDNPGLPLTESVTCSEFPTKLGTNKQCGKETILKTNNDVIFSETSDSGSETSTKENKKPKELVQDVDMWSDGIETDNLSKIGSKVLGENNILNNSVPKNVITIDPSGSGISSFVNRASSQSNMNNRQDNITKTDEDIIEDSDNDEDKFVIEATPEKLSESSKSAASTNSSQSRSCDLKDFCFVTSSLLPSQLRSVKILAEVLGCRINSNVTHETSHLIIQTCEKGRVKRTLKYLQALVLHKIVVSYNWVTASLEEKALLAVDPYIVCDTWGAPAVHRSLNNSGNYLLKNFAIAVVEPTAELTLSQIEELVDACGAIIIKDPRCFNFVPTNLLRIILTDKEDIQEEAIVCLKKYKAVALRVDWLISSIAQYEISPLNSYLLVPMEAEILIRLGFPEVLTVEENDTEVAD